MTPDINIDLFSSVVPVFKSENLHLIRYMVLDKKGLLKIDDTVFDRDVERFWSDLFAIFDRLSKKEPIGHCNGLISIQDLHARRESMWEKFVLLHGKSRDVVRVIRQREWEPALEMGKKLSLKKAVLVKMQKDVQAMISQFQEKSSLVVGLEERWSAIQAAKKEKKEYSGDARAQRAKEEEEKCQLGLQCLREFCEDFCGLASEWKTILDNCVVAVLSAHTEVESLILTERDFASSDSNPVIMTPAPFVFIFTALCILIFSPKWKLFFLKAKS